MQQRAQRGSPFGWLVARFHRSYPGLWYLPGHWRTRDGVIPYKLFYLLIDALDSVDAVRELETARAVLLGYGLARAGKNAKVKEAHRKLVRRAFPKKSLIVRPNDASTDTR